MVHAIWFVLVDKMSGIGQSDHCQVADNPVQFIQIVSIECVILESL